MEKTYEKKDFLQKTWVVCALALVCTFLWGSASPCIKLGYALFKIPSSETWTQVLFAGTRFVFAGVLTILIGSILNRKMLLPTKSSVPSIVKLAMFQTILQYIFFYIGLAHNSGVKASIINGSNTFFVILVSTIIFRQEKLNLKKIIGCVIGFAGVIVVSMNGQKIDMKSVLMCVVVCIFIMPYEELFKERQSGNVERLSVHIRWNSNDYIRTCDGR